MQIETDVSILGIVILDKRMRETADSKTKGWQRRVKKGDCFLRRTADGLEIYGEVLEDYDMEDMKNFRRCRCCSLACPEGEIGNVHVSHFDSLIARGKLEKVKTKLQRGWKLAMSMLEAEGYI